MNHQQTANNSPDITILMRWLRGGGAERVIANLARGFSERGLKVDLVLLTADGVYLSQLPSEIRVISLSQGVEKPKWVRLPTGFQSIGSLPKLVRYLQQNQPKVLLSATHFLNEIAVLAKHLARVSTKVMVSEHTTLSLEAKYVEQISARLAPLTTRLLYPLADQIIAVSDGVAQDLAHTSGLSIDTIKVIYNPVLLPEFFKVAQEPVAHPWFQPGQPPVILGVGRFVRQKDFPTLIRAFSEVRQHRPARLLLLGGGRDWSQLQALIQELQLENEVELVEFVANPYAYMSKAAVFVLSSQWEGLPTVLIEAMALGISIVATDCKSGPAEVLNSGKYGSLIPVGNSQMMAQAILDMLQSPSPCQDQAWLQQFTLENSVEQYLKLFNIGINRTTSRQAVSLSKERRA